MPNVQIRTSLTTETPLTDLKRVSIQQVADFITGTLEAYPILSPLEKIHALELVMFSVTTRGLEKEWKE